MKDICGISQHKFQPLFFSQLKEMGENTDEYATIWHYCEGKTEPHFSLYEYPPYPFKTTNKMTNLQIDD
ncbi:hypothetical protein FACS189441_8570 [Betaproteobacteria bacterium]|nr:hypothetical protein FACS189441_8570 [Betaproteobacteria bacterium]